MSKTRLVEALREIGIIASIRVQAERHLLPGIAALADGGVLAVELPYTAARDTGWPIQQLKQSGLLVGVGAVTRSEQAREASLFGADFITASVTTPDVVAACDETDVPCILSSLTPTEIWRAYEMEADFVKIVAAEALGGPHYISSLRETLPALRLVGADMMLDNSVQYLEAGVEVLEFGSSLGLRRLIEQEAWLEISQRASNIVDARNDWRARQL